MNEIHGRVAETDMDELLPMLEDVHRMARDEGHVDEESEFDFNDMDDFAFAVAGEEDALYLRCQNTVHAVLMSPSRDLVRVLSVTRDYESEDDRMPGKIASALRGEDVSWSAVLVRKDGTFSLAAPFPGRPDDIRNWYALANLVESAHCCLEEKLQVGSVGPA